MFVEMPIAAVAPVLGNNDVSDESLLHESSIIQTTDDAYSIIGEIEVERTEYSKTFRLNNGASIVATYPVPVHYKDNTGNWSDYDNSLSSIEKEYYISEAPSLIKESTVDSVSSNNGSFTVSESDIRTENKQMLKNRKSDTDISFAKESSSENMVFVEKGDHTVSWGYKDINSKSVKQKNEKKDRAGNDKFTVLDNLTSTVVYESVYDGVDIECITTPVGVKENIILNQKSATNKFVSTYDIGDLHAEKINDREIALYSDDKVEYYINALYMYDANNATSESIVLNIIENSNGKLVVELVADEQWLNSADRAYPVTIDPSFIYGQEWGDVQCTFVDSAHPDTSYGYGSDTGYTGTIYTGILGTTEYLSLMKINELPELNKGDMIVGAYVNLGAYNTVFSNVEYVGIYEITQEWTQDEVTWNEQPQCSNLLIDYFKTSDLSSHNYWYQWDITTLVKKWYNGDANNGFYIKMLDETTTQSAGFYSSNYPSNSGIRPAFELVYRNNKGIENYWNYTSVNVGNVGTAYINDYSGALTFELPITTTADPLMPANVSYVYNSYMANTKYNKHAPYSGNGWRMNMQQTLLPSSEYGLTGDDAANYPYVYTDLDGTEHYFYKKNEDGVTKYYDEDGLKLELTINSSSTGERYLITDEDKNKLYFHHTGLLNRFEDAYGNVQKVNYDGTTITHITDETGNMITVNRNSNDYVTHISDPSNRTTGFTYDANNNITAVTYPDTKVATINYNSDGLITEVIDVDGYKVVFTYNSLNQVESLTEYGKDNIEGQTITFDRENYNETKVYTNGVDGQNNTSDDCITTYQFDNWGRTVSTQTSTNDGSELGASSTTYTSESNIKTVNKVTDTHVLGANAVNYIQNSNLEGTSKWYNTAWLGDATYSIGWGDTQKLYGQQSFSITTTAYTGIGAGSIYQDVTSLSPNTTYTLSGYVKVASITESNESNYGAVVSAAVYETDGSVTNCFSEYISEITDTTINDGWRRVSVTFTTPETLAKVRVHLAMKSTIGTVYFDGIQLEKSSNVSSYNFVQNGSMELYTNNRPTYWNNYSNIAFTNSSDGISEESQHDSVSFRIMGDAKKNKILYQEIPVSGTENDTYILSAWAKTQTAVPISGDIKFKITVKVLFDDGTDVTKETPSFNTSITSWQYLSTAFNLSDETDSNKTPVAIRIFPNYSFQGNRAYFDNIQLIKEPAQSYVYDNEGNMVSVVDNAKQNSTLKYNAENKLTEYVDPKGYKYEYTYYDDTGSLKTAKTNRGATYTYDYDTRGAVSTLTGTTQAGHLIKSTQSVTYPTETSTEYEVVTTDALNRQTTSTYNSKNGTLKKFEDSKGATTYTYNTSNDILASVSQGGATVSYIYDASYKNLTGIETGTSSYTFEYDAFGNRTSVKVGNKTLATYIYKANNGPLQQMNYGNGDSVSYTYDKYGNVSKKYLNGTLVFEGFADNTGAITKAIDHKNNIQYNYVYDSLGRLVSSTRTDITDNKRISMFEYAFDLNNNPTKLSVLSSNGTNTTNYTYGKDNQPDTVTFNNGAILTYNYDTLGRNSKVTINTTNPIETFYYYHSYTDENGTKHNSNLLGMESSEDFKYRYVYDDRNNITVVQAVSYDADGNAVYTPIEEYTYDALNQLTQVDYLTQNKRVVYTYDSGGNITKEKIYTVADDGTATLSDTKSYVYGDANWRDKLTKYDGQTITYDVIGNPLAYRDGMTMSWSNGRQLQSLTKDGKTVSYTYDDSGMRLSKTVDGVEYTYLYQNGLLVQETVGNRILDYSYDSNGRLSMVRYRIPYQNYDVSFYYALNSRGDVIGLYNSTGDLIAKYNYDVWGNVLSVTNTTGAEITSSTHIALLQPFRYRSYYYDKESNFYYLQSRYYDPVTHRFINADGILDERSVLGYNLYVYCVNNPIIYSDPLGLCSNAWAAGYQGPCPGKGKPGCMDYWYGVRDVTAEVDSKLLSAAEHGVELRNKLNNNPYIYTPLKLGIIYIQFLSLVNHNAPWDIKRDKPWESTIGTPYPGENSIVFYHDYRINLQELGNYTYGFLGYNYGIPLNILYAGSYVAAGLPIDKSEFNHEVYEDWPWIENGYNDAKNGF